MARIDVSIIPRWRDILSSRRRQPNIQHDVAEFLMHMLQLGALSDMSGMWTAFRGDRNVDESDLSTSVVPLTMVRGNKQQLIDNWHQDGELRRFLVIPPKLIVIQLLRFRVASGRTRKLTSKVDTPRTIRIPSLCNAQSSQTVYKVAGGIIHLGGAPSSGHYRAFVRRSHQDGGSDLITDDDQMPRDITSQDADLIQSKVYLIFGVREAE